MLVSLLEKSVCVIIQGVLKCEEGLTSLKIRSRFSSWDPASVVTKETNWLEVLQLISEFQTAKHLVVRGFLL